MLPDVATKRTNIETRHCKHRICCIDCRYDVTSLIALLCRAAASATCFDRVFYPYFLMRGDLKELDSHFSLHGISSAPPTTRTRVDLHQVVGIGSYLECD